MKGGFYFTIFGATTRLKISAVGLRRNWKNQLVFPNAINIFILLFLKKEVLNIRKNIAPIRSIKLLCQFICHYILLPMSQMTTARTRVFIPTKQGTEREAIIPRSFPAFSPGYYKNRLAEIKRADGNEGFNNPLNVFGKIKRKM